MEKFNTKRLFRLADLNDEMLRFRLTKKQRARVPRGSEIVFRKSTQPYKNKGYKHFLSRAEYTSTDPKKKGRAVSAASHLIGIIWDDDPEWVYETDKSKSSIAARRTAAVASKHKSSRLVTSMVASMFQETVEYLEGAIIVKKVPVPIFLTVALICACRGLTDATSVANYWNNNLTFLKKLFPAIDFFEISHDSVRRIYLSLTEGAVKKMLSNFYDWIPKKATADGKRHYALDGQADRASRHYATDRRMMLMNCVDVTSGKLCASHTLIDTKSNEPKYVPDLLESFNVRGATVTLDALNTTRPIATAIAKSGGFYILALKNNNSKTLDAVRKLLDKAVEERTAKFDGCGTEKAHGRIDTRDYAVAPAAGLDEEISSQWIGLKEGCVIEAVTYSRRKDGQGKMRESMEKRWFITNHPYGNGEIAEWLAQCIRGHWGVESFHWVMDMVWRQDQMQCQYPSYLWTRETLAKIAHNLMVTFQKIDQGERKLSVPRSISQLTHEVGVTLENGLAFLLRIQEELEAKTA